MHPNLDTITLELVDDVLTELDALAPALEELAERAGAALFAVTWDEATEEQPESAERLHGELVRLSAELLRAAT